jgi:hypothetical protein
VREDKTEVLIKIVIAKKKNAETEMLLYLIRKAAVRHGYRIRARNVVYLDISTGNERMCPDRITDLIVLLPRQPGGLRKFGRASQRGSNTPTKRVTHAGLSIRAREMSDVSAPAFLVWTWYDLPRICWMIT